ncbi:hypothetical protein [Xylanimonas sp. McL0601]|uniref:hypothetical protein n=1 Tax=Xylanimonas sp. McL0601 TaxID=3414739 RepID=UPI003CF0EAA9
MSTAAHGTTALRIALGVVLATTLAGCVDAHGSPSDAVREFQAALRRGDGPAACALLTPAAAEAVAADAGIPCADALGRGDVGEELRARGVGTSLSTRVAGMQAQVTTGDDVLFLAASGGAWRITAAGCDPRPGRPYDCEVES